ncbi:unnamed protein product [Parnassius apollo]|uniref:(apollo) hypothetical protein n=1 Tax=Parnassius apollo TaxID=110799 RepID=A0A8S3X8P6_PARAO|nr:unnamed protein product [Parnassius apollo]
MNNVIRMHCRAAEDWSTKGDEGAGPSVSVVGLRLCGCVWRAALAPAPADASVHAAAPPLRLRYLPSTEITLTSSRLLEVPVYSNESREELLFHVNAPLAPDFDKDTAILNAIALFIGPVD